MYSLVQNHIPKKKQILHLMAIEHEVVHQMAPNETRSTRHKNPFPVFVRSELYLWITASLWNISKLMKLMKKLITC